MQQRRIFEVLGNHLARRLLKDWAPSIEIKSSLCKPTLRNAKPTIGIRQGKAHKRPASLQSGSGWLRNL